MEEFLLSLGLIFVAEPGDKTQLVALTLATRFRAGVVLAGIFVATLLVHCFVRGHRWLYRHSSFRGLD